MLFFTKNKGNDQLKVNLSLIIKNLKYSGILTVRTGKKVVCRV